MRRKKLNFVDDVKVAQPVRVSRSSSIDLINGEGIGEDLGHVEEHLNLFSFKDMLSPQKFTLAPSSPTTDTTSPVVSPTPTTTTTTTEGCASLTEISNTDTGVNGTRTQVFQVGPIVNDGFTYTLEVYSHPVTVNASTDTPSSIASKLASAINSTSAAAWNSVGSAATGKNGFPPKASASGDKVSATLNYQNQFAADASGCTQAPPPPPPPPIGPSINIKPTVDAGNNQQIKLPTSSATFNGSISGGVSAQSQWSYVSGPQGVTPAISSPANPKSSVGNLTIPGDYTFQLTGYSTDLTLHSPIPNSSASDTVVITVLAPDIPGPASNSTIDGWDCATLNTYLNKYNQLLSDPTLTGQTRTDYENALLHINNRISTVCNPSPTPAIDTSAATSTPPPLPTAAQIDAMNCDQLLALKTSLTTNDPAYRTDATTLQSFINTSNYVDLQFTQKCKNPNPTAPTVEIYAPGTTPYGRSSGGGGGTGGSSSKSTATPQMQQKSKTWWWIGLIVVAGALILFKPGTKVGVPSK